MAAISKWQVTVYPVAVGSKTDEAQLLELAGGDESRVLRSPGYAALAAEGQKLSGKTCPTSK